ncbi:hypothetical protein QBC45DRAFT_454729 [Copromyces sp. CBS 386.78]|nr:hypothetical protein QBC45DRAFT_454729 [Copromyces sp. CBS 386.78]
MDFRKYHDRDQYPYESRRTSDHARHRHEERSDDYHHTSARMRDKGGHRYQDEFDVPASQPEKTDYVQSWLQRSQATRVRPPEPIPEDRPQKISPRVHMVKQASQKKKRTRSESSEPVHTREAHSPVALRFEKRSRHKTRPDKYEYKPEVDQSKRRTKTKEHCREDSYGSLEDVQRPKRGEYQHVQRSNNHAHRADHSPPRHQSFKAKEIETLPRRLDHKPRAVEPRPRSRKQQAENKELEELSAFFTRRADGGIAEAEKIRHRTRREQRHETAARHIPSDARQEQINNYPTTSLQPSRCIASTRQPSHASLHQPDTHFSSRGDDRTDILSARPSSRSTTYFTWSISDRDPNARAPASNESTSERPQRSIQSPARKVVLQERKMQGPNVILEDLKIRPTSRATHRPQKLIVYKDTQVQTSFDAEMAQNRQHAKRTAPQYRDSAVMTADVNSNLKQRVSMLDEESMAPADMNKSPVDEQPLPNTTPARPMGPPPRPYSQPPQAWATYNAEDRLISRPFVAASNLLTQGGWQTDQELSTRQAVGRYTQLFPPSRTQAGFLNTYQPSLCTLLHRSRLVRAWKITSTGSSKKPSKIPPTMKKLMNYSPVVLT